MADDNRLQIKVCGITRLQDAEGAVEAGATMLGLIFVEASPRNVPLEQAEKICAQLKSAVKLVGVVQDAAPEKVSALQKHLGLHYIQYHGSENAAICSASGSAIKAISLEQPEQLGQAVKAYKSAVDMILIDRPKGFASPDWLDHFTAALSGASGRSQIKLQLPFLLAGGLSPANVGKVVQVLLQVENFQGVDVASGVEEAPGVKDLEKVRQFIKAAKQGVDHAVLG